MYEITYKTKKRPWPMPIDAVYQSLLNFLFGFSVLTLAASFFYTTPYGRFMKHDEKFSLPSLLGWLLMEAPCLIACLATFLLSGGHNTALVPVLFMVIWQSHYVYRAIIFPLRMRDRGKRMPISAVAFGMGFNTLNGFLNGYAFSHSEHLLDTTWLTTPQFIAGIGLMILGLGINIYSDNILRKLRAPGETGYKIPRGGLYRWVSAPNYLGEIIEWAGLALAASTPAALAFLAFSVANLLPRAVAHHRWYREHFPAYPAERKAIIPGIL
jgi:3-oxo-5-alpha-steroid 4-dehydrogenase 1